MQIAPLLHRILSSSAARLVLPHFSTFYYKRHDFRKNNLLNIKCVFILSTNLSQTLPTIRIIQQGIIINVNRYSGKVPVIRGRF